LLLPQLQHRHWLPILNRLCSVRTAFRFEGAAGFERISLEEDGDPDENIDLGIFNTAFSTAFQGPVGFAQMDGVFGTSHGHDNGNPGTNTQFTGDIFLGWRDMNTGFLAGNLAISGYETAIDPALLRAGGQELSSHAAMAGIRICFVEPETTTVKSQNRVHFTDSCAFGTAGKSLSIC